MWGTFARTIRERDRLIEGLKTAKKGVQGLINEREAEIDVPSDLNPLPEGSNTITEMLEACDAKIKAILQRFKT